MKFIQYKTFTESEIAYMSQLIKKPAPCYDSDMVKMLTKLELITQSTTEHIGSDGSVLPEYKLTSLGYSLMDWHRNTNGQKDFELVYGNKP